MIRAQNPLDTAVSSSSVHSCFLQEIGSFKTKKNSNSFFNLIVDRVFQTKMLLSFNINDFKNVALASQYCYQLARFRHRNVFLIGRDHLPLGKL